MTLEAYPVVLKELDLANQLVDSQKKAIELLNKEIEQHVLLSENKNSQLSNVKSERDIYKSENKQLKKENKFLKVLGGAAVIGAFVLGVSL